MTKRYTPREERWNAWSHVGGIVLGVAAGFVFLSRCCAAGNGWATAGVGLYLLGMLASYVSSVTYHALPDGSRKERWRRRDHAAIYWHIAGSYSPIALLALRTQGGWGWGIFAFIWACAALGTLASFIKLKEHSHAETICFVVMGLSVLVAFGPLINSVSKASIAWIVAEGVAYITGALFYSLRKRQYMHTIFHFFVLAGSGCHVMAVWEVLKQYA